jgi:hypothetical protein
MRRSMLVLLTALAGSAGVAQEADPLKSADCRQALDVLQAHEARLPAAPGQAQGPSQREDLKQLDALRRHAARACLGDRGDPATASPRFSPPVTVPPVAVRPSTPAPALPVRPSVSLPPAVQPTPAAVTACDPNGCWASDGSRLQRFGPNLYGPRGVCILRGAVLQCP